MKKTNNKEHFKDWSKHIWYLFTNGNSIITFKPQSKKEDICEVLSEFVNANPNKRIILMLDNFSSHRSKLVREYAEDQNITLVFLPPNSPDLNPIEQIWRTIKR